MRKLIKSPSPPPVLDMEKIHAAIARQKAIATPAGVQMDKVQRAVDRLTLREPAKPKSCTKLPAVDSARRKPISPAAREAVRCIGFNHSNFYH
jgi:hypothetical protein